MAVAREAKPSPEECERHVRAAERRVPEKRGVVEAEWGLVFVRGPFPDYKKKRKK